MQDISFNGLTSTLRGNIYRNFTIRSLAYSFPQSKGSVGSVPAEWLSKIPVSARKNFVIDLYKVFSEIVEIQRNTIFFANRKSSEILKNFFTGHGIIGEKEKLKFKNAGYGSFADVVRFNVGNNKYALKIFSMNDLLSREITSKFGNCAEQNNALYINARENSDWVKFYFGNIFDQYLVTKYVDDNTPFPKKKIKLSDIGLQFIDYDIKNIKSNINIDYGGHEALKDFPIGNKVAMWIIKRLKNMPLDERLKEIEKITANKKVPNYYDRMTGVKYIQTHVIPKEIEYNSRKKGFFHSLISAFLGLYTD